jgi:hypothetical protein
MSFPEQKRRWRELDELDGAVLAPPLAVAEAQADEIVDKGRRGVAAMRAALGRC